MPQVKVTVSLKPSLLDAQGRVVEGALSALGYDCVNQVRVGKYMELDIAEGTQDVEGKVREMCSRLLANPVIEDYKIEVAE